MGGVRPEYLATIDGREIYLAPPDSTHHEPFLVYRLQDIREALQALPGWKILGADYCVHPDTKILTTDLEWVDAGSIKENRLVVGFDENATGKGKRRMLHRTPVECLTYLKQPCVRIVTTHGDLICSEEHRWLVRKSGTSGLLKWLRAIDIPVGWSIAHFGEPWKTDTSYDAGYLAGFLDGEGYISDGIGLAQNQGSVWNRINQLVKARGLDLSSWPAKTGTCIKARVTGGLYEALRLLGEVRPIRLIENCQDRLLEGHTTSGQTRPSKEVLAVEKVGEQDVVGIQTGTKTFIGGGFLSHNSQIEVRIMAKESGDPWLIAALNSGKDIHCYMAADVNNINYDIFYAIYKDKDHPLHFEYNGLRSEIKTTTFGVPYGAMGPTIRDQINSTRPKEKWITTAYADEVIERYFSKAVVLKQYLIECGDHALKHKFSKSTGGHYRFYVLPDTSDDKYDEQIAQIRRWSGNHPIQAGCADILKMAIGKIACDLHEDGLLNRPLKYDAHFALFVHDEIVMMVKDEHVEPVKQIMIDGMQWSYDRVVGLKNIIHTTDVTVDTFWRK